MIDAVGLKILKILQEKARIPNVEVARQVGMAPSAVLERIRKLEKQGFIDGYEVRLNPKRFAKSLVAFVRVKIKKLGDEKKIGEKLTRIAAVQEVHYVAGEDAFLVKVRPTPKISVGSSVIKSRRLRRYDPLKRRLCCRRIRRRPGYRLKLKVPKMPKLS
jgi:Lrp/AsnC family leucine-responsive transcriptional regulator